MRPVVAFVLLAALAGCGESGPRPSGIQQSGQSDQGLSLSVAFDEPLRSGRPVTWTLTVENGGEEAVTLVFRSGKDGDVVLVRDGGEAYRWSANRYFSQAMREVRLDPGERRTFPLEEKALPVGAGDYELLAELDSQPAPPAARRSVGVEGG